VLDVDDFSLHATFMQLVVERAIDHVIERAMDCTSTVN
jgi:hypothetical protein